MPAWRTRREDGTLPDHFAPPGSADQSAALSGHGHAVHAHDGPPAPPEAGAAGQSLPRAGGTRGGRGHDRDPTKEEEKEKTANENETDWEEILLNGFEVPGGVREEYEHKEYTEPVSVETTDLIDHLREQLQMMVLSPRQALLSEEFLGNIKEDGYLAASVEEIQRLANEMLDSYAERNRSDSEEELAEAGDMDAEPEPEPRQSPVRPCRISRRRKWKKCWGSCNGSIRPASRPGTCASASCSSSANSRRPTLSPTALWLRRSRT